MPTFSETIGAAYYYYVYGGSLILFLYYSTKSLRKPISTNFRAVPDYYILVFLFLLMSIQIFDFYVNDYGQEKSRKILLNFFVFGCVASRLFANRAFSKTFFWSLVVISFLYSFVLVVTFPFASGRINVLNSNPIWTARYSGILALTMFALLLTKEQSQAARANRKKNFRGRSAKSKIILVCAIVLSLTAIVVTGSAGPLVSAIFAMTLYMLLGFNVRIAVLFTVTFMASIVILQFSLVDVSFEGSVLDRFTGTSILERAVEGTRSDLYLLAIELGRENVGGVGIGGFVDYAWQRYPHNLFLEIYAEWGIISLVVAILVLISIGVQVVRRMHSESVIVNFLCLVCVYTLVNSMFSGDAASLKMFYAASGGLFFAKS